MLGSLTFVAFLLTPLALGIPAQIDRTTSVAKQAPRCEVSVSIGVPGSELPQSKGSSNRVCEFFRCRSNRPPQEISLQGTLVQNYAQNVCVYELEQPWLGESAFAVLPGADDVGWSHWESDISVLNSIGKVLFQTQISTVKEEKVPLAVIKRPNDLMPIDETRRMGILRALELSSISYMKCFTSMRRLYETVVQLRVQYFDAGVHLTDDMFETILKIDNLRFNDFWTVAEPAGWLPDSVLTDWVEVPTLPENNELLARLRAASPPRQVFNCNSLLPESRRPIQ